MTLSSQDAIEALRDIDRVGQRTRQLTGYARSSPYLLLWGVIWFLGYGGCYLRPQQSGWIWAVLDTVGLVASIVISSRLAARRGATASRGGRAFGLVAIACGLILATDVLMGPMTMNQAGAFPALLAAAVYAGVGLWAGPRWLVLGTTLALLTAAGYWWTPAYFMLWMAFAGGGALILAGLWLRQV